MQFDYTARFKRLYQRLPPEIRERANKQLALLLENPQHPSLRLKKMEGFPNMWEISVTLNSRVIFHIEDDRYVLFKVGTHDILKK